MTSALLADGPIATVTAVPALPGKTSLLNVAGSASSLTGTTVLLSTTSGSVTTPAGVSVECAAAKILCVDDTPGPTQEFSTIQAAASAAVAGNQIVVYPGAYASFRVTRSGSNTSAIVFKTSGAVTITSPSGDAISIANASWITIDGFTVVNPTGRCLNADGAAAGSPMKGLKILNVSCSGAQTGGFRFVSVTNSLVQGNTIATIARSHGIYFENGSSDKNTVVRNVIHDLNDAAASGIVLNANAAAGSDGIIQNTVLDGNVIYDVPVDGISLDGVQNSTVQNNVVYGINGSAFRAFRTAGAAGPKTLRLVNNSFHTPATGAWVLRTSEDLGSHIIFNNILLSDRATQPGVSLGTKASLRSDYNVLTVADLIGQVKLGFDSHSFAAKAAQLFVAPGSDYRPASASFATDRGTAAFATITAPTLDGGNQTRPNGTAPDIGAYEALGAAAAPLPVVAITAPAVGAAVSGITSITTSITGSWTPTVVEFYVDGVKIGEDTASPFSLAWNTSTVSSDVHGLMVFARDAAGLMLASSKVTISVSSVPVPPALTSLTILSSLTTVNTGQPVTFTAAIVPAIAPGAVQFRDGSTVIGTANLTNGAAAFATSSLAVGTHSISASYAGGAGFAASTSAVVTITVKSSTDPCADPRTLCVDDQSGSTQEYTTIQSASNAALAGDTVLVFPGTYAGFRVTTSGFANSLLTFKGNGPAGSVVIGTASSTGDGIRLDNVSNVVVDNFSISNISGACIAMRGATPTQPMTNLAIRNNSCAGARGMAGIYASQVNGSEISGNTISGLTTSRTHGIYLANAGSDNTVLRKNTIFNITGSEGAGIHMNGDLSVGGDGIISGVLIDSNTIYDINFNGISMDGVQSTTVVNNVIFRVAKAAVRGFQEDGAQGPKAMRFINNSFHATGGWAIKLSEDLGGHQVFNNILLTNSSSAGSICIGVTTGFASSNNAVVNRFSRDTEDTVVSLASWQSAGFETASFVSTVSALFTNAAAGDYRLINGAAAIDKGLASFGSSTAPAVDRAGVARPRGAAIDIGAFEK